MRKARLPWLSRSEKTFAPHFPCTSPYSRERAETQWRLALWPFPTLWFYLNLSRRPDDPARPTRQPLDHPAGIREITRVRIMGPGGDCASAVAEAVVRTGAVLLEEATKHLMEITFDGGQEHLKDFRPALPLVFRWCTRNTGSQSLRL